MLPVVAAQCKELMFSSPLGPVEKMFKAVPSSPQQVSDQGA